MRKTITLLWAITMLFSCCKTRHVGIAQSHANTFAHMTSIVNKDSTRVDTGKVRTETKTLTLAKDSATVTVIPDSGAVEIVKIDAGQNFSYTGKAKSIVFKKTTDNQTAIDAATQENKGETTRNILADSLTEQKQTDTVIKNKAVTASANYTWQVALVILLALLIATAYLLRKFGVV